jgi:hypothetical protein
MSFMGVEPGYYYSKIQDIHKAGQFSATEFIIVGFY